MEQTERTIRELIRGIVQQVLDEEHDCADHEGQDHEEWEEEQDSIEEMNTTGNIAGYQTPHAFDDEDEEGHAKKIKDKAEVFDFKSTTNGKENTVKLNEGKSLYHIFRDHPDYSPEQKVGVTVREVNKLLTEIEKLLRVSSRFKSEANLKTDKFWKTTTRYMSSIDEKIFRISRKIKEIR